VQDWCGKVSTKNGDVVWWHWKLNEQMYPKAWFEKLHAKGIKVLTYVNTFLATSNSSQGDPPELYLEAARLGYLVEDAKGLPIIMKAAFADFSYAMVDLFNEDAWKWWVDVIRCNVMMACGSDAPLVHAWMHDYGEYIPLTARFGSSKRLGSDLHNRFPLMSSLAAREASKDFPDVTFFARSGGLQAPGAARMFWLGDQLTNWDGCDGLQSAMIGAMSSGLSGWTVTHADIGAFTMVDRLSWLPIPGIHFYRDSVLMIRWLEIGVFLNSLYRSHPGLVPSKASQPWSADVVNYTGSLARLFRDLGPYRRQLFEDAEFKGLPLVRHGLLVYPDDTTWFNHSLNYRKSFHCEAGDEIGLSQFFLGDEVIVAPALAEDQTRVYVYLPRGTWIHFWSQQRAAGPSYEQWNAPLGQPAFFFQADGRWADFFVELARQRSVQELVI